MRFRLFYLQLTLLGLAQPGCLGGQTGDTTGISTNSMGTPGNATSGGGDSNDDPLGSNSGSFADPPVILPGTPAGGTTSAGGTANVAGASGSGGSSGETNTGGTGGSAPLADGGLLENASIAATNDQARCDQGDAGADDAGTEDVGSEGEEFDDAAAPGCH